MPKCSPWTNPIEPILSQFIQQLLPLLERNHSHRRRSSCGFSVIVLLLMFVGSFASGQDEAVLKTIEAIQRVPGEELDKGLPVDLECIVMLYDPDWPILFVSDGRHGMYAGDRRDLALRPGDRVRIRGRLGAQRYPVDFTCEPSDNHIDLPLPKQVDYGWLQAGHEDSQWVEVEGQLVGHDQEQREFTLEMRTQNGDRFRGLIGDTKIDLVRLQQMLGKLIRLRGVVGARMDASMRWDGFQIWIANPIDIQELSNPGVPFEMPLTPIAGLTSDAIVESKSSYFKTEGIVTHQLAPTMVLLEDETSQQFVELNDKESVSLDAAYSVVGTLDTSVSPSVLRMARAIPSEASFTLRKDALKQSVETLIAGDFSGQLVRTDGTYAGSIESRGQRGFLLQCKGNLLPVFLCDGNIGEVATGTKVEVQGLWIQQKSLVGFNIGSSALHARRNGIHLGTQLPWPLICALTTAAAIAFVSGVWVVTLRKQVKRKTQQFLDSVALKRRMEEEYARVFLNARMMVMTTDPTGRLTAVNPAVVRVTGRDEASLIGMNVVNLVHALSQSDLKKLLCSAVESDQMLTSQVQLLGIDGSTVPQEVSCWATQSENERYLHLIWHDISERLRMEYERSEMEKQLLSMQKMESLGVLAGGIAHDFNNLLTVIVGNTSLLFTSQSLQQDELDSLVSIEQAATRAAELTQQMLAYAGRGKFDVRVLDVSKLVSEMSQLLTASVSKGTAVQFQLQTNLPGVQADATQLKQILLNLVRNASESMEGRTGAIRVQTTIADPRKAAGPPFSRASFFEFAAKDENQIFVCLDVSDDGNGMDESVVAKIFDPFFSTKFSGRGLGLSSVLGIVRGHQGCVQVFSTKGVGTTFRIYLPTCPEPIASLPSPHFATPKVDRVAHVIVVDDEPSILLVIAKTLETAGLQVTCCGGGKEAVAILQGQAPQIDLMITDQTMPEMTGLELCELLMQLQIRLPIVLCSGYSLGLISSEANPPGVKAILQKPFRPSELVDLVLRLIAESKAENELQQSLSH